MDGVASERPTEPAGRVTLERFGMWLLRFCVERSEHRNVFKLN